MSGKSIYKIRNKRCDRLATHVFLFNAKNRIYKQNTHTHTDTQSGAENSLYQFWLTITKAFSPFYLEETTNYRVFSHDVTAAILLSQNNETAAMLVSQTNPLGVELFSYANAFSRSNKFAQMLATWVKTFYTNYHSHNKAE